MKAKLLAFEDIAVGSAASFERTVTQEDMLQFAKLSGDYNPLHMDADYAAGTEFKSTVVHGIFLGSLVSRLVGMELPGQKALLMQETLTFKKPAHVGDTLMVSGCVTHKSESTRILQLQVRILRDNEVLAEGEVSVRVLP